MEHVDTETTAAYLTSMADTAAADIQRSASSMKNSVRAVLINRGFVPDEQGNMSKTRRTGALSTVEFVDTYLGFTLVRRSYSARGTLILENHLSSTETDLRDMLSLFPAL